MLRTNASTRAVLPMPASPVTNTITETLPHIYDKFMTYLPRRVYPRNLRKG